MIKLLSVIFIFVANVYAFTIEDLPKDFLETFEKYTKYELEVDIPAMYKMQVPYFTFIYPYEEFEYYIKALKKPKSIQISKVRELTDEKITILVGVEFCKNPKNMVYFERNWYKVNGKYYLLTKDGIIFR